GRRGRRRSARRRGRRSGGGTYAAGGAYAAVGNDDRGGHAATGGDRQLRRDQPAREQQERKLNRSTHGSAIGPDRGAFKFLQLSLDGRELGPYAGSLAIDHRPLLVDRPSARARLVPVDLDRPARTEPDVQPGGEGH